MYEIACRISVTILGGCRGYCCLLNKQMAFMFLGWWHSKGGMDNKNINYSFLRTFGCEAFVQNDKENRTKFQVKSKKCTFIGYGITDFGYHLRYYEYHRITKSRYVVFNEKVM